MTTDPPLLLGVRHHGPGSARAVRAVLAAHAPEVLLIEGPPEAEAVLGPAADPAMRPPVALLAHAVDEPGRAAFWPLAAFSPEWVALRWALDRGVPVRFIDLPAAHSLAMDEEPGAADGDPRPAGRAPDGGPGDGPPHPGVRDDHERGDGRRPSAADPSAADPSAADLPVGAPPAADGQATGGGPGADLDPLALLAEAAGHDDPERWWEDLVEHRGSGGAPAGPGGDAPGPAEAALAAFEALAEAMTALREAHGADIRRRDLLREAQMRLRLREVAREFPGTRQAVVCGAWHVPALREKHTVAADRRLLKGLPKVRAELSWVPWTHRRLARRSGYGAGVDAPGWYSHLFEAPDRPIERWMTRIAGLLRAEDHQVSSAHVIEAVRLAEGLAVLRGRPLAGLTETLDAARSVLCEGSDVPFALIRDRLVVGDVLGEVPASAPAVPLQRDLDRLQRALRMRPEAGARDLDLDLRKENDAARSRLLHRLRLLDLRWGEPRPGRPGGTGTFRESWRLDWQPELSVRVAEAGVWGTTVAAAATSAAVARAREAGALAELTRLAESCLPAGLDSALPVVVRELADRAALDSDVGHLAQALPALVRAARYGDVRGTDTASFRRLAEGLAERVRVGLAPACSGLDADGAAAMRAHLDAAHRAICLLDAPGLRERWQTVLRTLTERSRIPALLRGRAARLLLDGGGLDTDGPGDGGAGPSGGEAARLMGLALSPGTPPAEAADWIEGFLAGGGMLLVHDERLLALVDEWLTRVPEDAFIDVLPLLRRTFSAYDSAVRRTVGELVRRGTGDRGGPPSGPADPPDGFAAEPDEARTAAVLPVLRLLLGDESASALGIGPAPGPGPEPGGSGSGGPGPAPGEGTADALAPAAPAPAPAGPDALAGPDAPAGSDAPATPDVPAAAAAAAPGRRSV